MIIQISGKLRQGKGILAVLIALMYAERGFRVLCNFTINHPNCCKITFLDFMRLLEKPRSEENTAVVIDELPTWVDSYTTTKSESNRFASHLINQSAKLGYDPVVYTTQRTRRADINYRELADVSLRAVKHGGCGLKKCRLNCVGLKRCYYEYLVLDPNFSDVDVLTGKSFKIPFIMAARWWGRYDTFESVKPVGLEQFLTKLEKTGYA